MGQARQEELINYIFEKGYDDKVFLRKLFINLSPYERTDSNWKKKMGKRMPVVIEKKKSKRQLRIESLQHELDACEKEKKSLLQKKQSLKVYETVSMIVYHKKWGEGIIVDCKPVESGIHLFVDFSIGIKKIKAPDAFEKGLLVSEYADYVDNQRAHKELDDSIKILDESIAEKKSLLQKLVV